jgi:hypothetical protein
MLASTSLPTMKLAFVSLLLAASLSLTSAATVPLNDTALSFTPSSSSWTQYASTRALGDSVRSTTAAGASIMIMFQSTFSPLFYPARRAADHRGNRFRDHDHWRKRRSVQHRPRRTAATPPLLDSQPRFALSLLHDWAGPQIVAYDRYDSPGGRWDAAAVQRGEGRDIVSFAFVLAKACADSSL